MSLSIFSNTLNSSANSQAYKITKNQWWTKWYVSGNMLLFNPKFTLLNSVFYLNDIETLYNISNPLTYYGYWHWWVDALDGFVGYNFVCFLCFMDDLVRWTWERHDWDGITVRIYRHTVWQWQYATYQVCKT